MNRELIQAVEEFLSLDDKGYNTSEMYQDLKKALQKAKEGGNKQTLTDLFSEWLSKDRELISDAEIELAQDFCGYIDSFKDPEWIRLLTDEPKNEQNGKTEQLNAEEFLKSIGFDYAHLPELFNNDDKSYYKITDLLESYSNQSKNEIQQRDLTIQELSEQLIESNQSKWISVEDRLPEKNEDVLTFDSEGYIDVCVYEFREDGNVFMVTDTCSVLKNVTHWQPLPQPPVNNDKQ